MKISTLGIILTIIGIFMIAYTSLGFITREKVVDIGPIQITKENKYPLEWPSILGAAILISGVTVLIVDKKK
jgi:uncharacterized membrane protein YdcZ (DUF606 family)